MFKSLWKTSRVSPILICFTSKFTAERGVPVECDKFAILSQAILDHMDPGYNENEFTKLLADSHQYQAIAGIDTNGNGALEHGQKWLALMVDRVQKYDDPEDALMLPMVYNELGMSYMRVPLKEEAIKSWKLAIDGLINNAPNDPLIATWPTINLGLLYAVVGRAGEGYEIVSPILSARDKAFGRDDKTAFE